MVLTEPKTMSFLAKSENPKNNLQRLLDPNLRWDDINDKYYIEFNLTSSIDVTN
jgi:hypothetical protein